MFHATGIDNSELGDFASGSGGGWNSNERGCRFLDAVAVDEDFIRLADLSGNTADQLGGVDSSSTSDGDYNFARVLAKGFKAFLYFLHPRESGCDFELDNFSIFPAVCQFLFSA